MARRIDLDDHFVKLQLEPVADTWKPLLQQAGDKSDVEIWRLDRPIEQETDDCLELFDQHHGIPPGGPIPEAHQIEREFLNYSFDIVGKVLNLETAVPIFRRIVEVDWLAHVELDKEKRYRDHITHPVRVTAIGWWLLHRKDDHLLNELAGHYERATQSYRAESNIDTRPHSWRRIVEFAWLACGLLHDSAYPLEYHLRAGEGLREGYGDPLKIFAPIAEKFSTDPGQQAVLKPLASSWFADQKLDPDLSARMTALPGGKDPFKYAHALVGPLHHLLSLGPRLHSLQGLATQLAARAIVTHHDQENQGIVADPLALLLFVADNLQGWQRPFLHSNSATRKKGPFTLRPIVECRRIELVPEKNGYVARFRMNQGPKAILKGAPYKWSFEEFRKPNQRLEHLLREDELLPSIVLTQPDCIQPREFFEFMQAPCE